MDVAVLPFGGAGAFPEILGDHLTGRNPANQKRSHIPVVRSNDIVPTHGGGVPHGDRFHPVAGVDSAHDPSLPVQGCHAVFQGPSETKVVVHLQQVGSFDVFHRIRSLHCDLLGSE